MDLAYYLIDLLGQRGEVSVPGLGHFFYARVNATYKADEARIYPPGQKLEFEQKPVNGDDAFAAFISQKKNISMASARYFVDRYVNDVVQETAIRDFAVADKGWLRNDGFQIVFKNADTAAGNTVNFGLPALHLPKKGQQKVKITTVVLTPPPPVMDEPQTVSQQPVVEQPQVNEPAIIAPQITVTPDAQQTVTQHTAPVTETPEAGFVEDEKRGLNVWVITAIVVALLAIAGIGLYMYNPGLLGLDGDNRAATVIPTTDSLANSVDTATVEPENTPGALAKTGDTTEPQANMSLNDSVKTVVIDSPAAVKKPGAGVQAVKPQPEAVQPATKPAATAPATGYPYTVIIGGSFATVQEAEKCIVNYKKLGLEAHILAEPGYGKKRKVVIGTYKTLAEALTEKNKLIKSKKVRDDAYTLEITKKR